MSLQVLLSDYRYDDVDSVFMQVLKKQAPSVDGLNANLDNFQ